MIVAQLAIPLAAAVAAVFAIWFTLDILLRTRPSDAVATAAERTRELAGSFVWRLVALSMAAAIGAGAGLGALVGVYREGVESGAVAGLAVVAGALGAAVTASGGAALGQRASERAATAADRTLRQALAITLWAGAAPALVGGALAVAGVGALYGVATRFADLPGGEAAFLVLGAGAGAALTALAARLLASSESNEDEGPEAEALVAAGSAAGGAETLALIAAGGAAGLVLGAPIALLTDETVWLVAPLVVQALGLAAATIAAITLPFWARALRNAGRAVVAGYAVAALLAAALAFATPLVLLEEGRWWFAGAALTGAGMSALIFIAGRVLLRDRGGDRGMGAGAVFALLAGAALVGAFLLGWQVEIEGVSQTSTALYGVAMAAAGALALAPAASAVRWFGSGAANAAALAERARESAPASGEGPAPLPLGPLTATAGRALAPGWSHALGWTVLVGAVSVAALLLAVRTELGNVAAEDLPRYVQLASELGVVPEFEEFQAAAAYELDSYRDLLDRHDVPESDNPQLLLAGEDEARRLLMLRAEQGQLDEGVEAMGGRSMAVPGAAAAAARQPDGRGGVAGAGGAARGDRARDGRGALAGGAGGGGAAAGGGGAGGGGAHREAAGGRERRLGGGCGGGAGGTDRGAGSGRARRRRSGRGGGGGADAGGLAGGGRGRDRPGAGGRIGQISIRSAK